MKALIISNGEIEDIDLLKKVSEDVDFILCADGGANYAIKASVKPDLVVGDLDSIDLDVLDRLKSQDIQFIKFPTKKDNTDTELAIEYLIDKGYDEIILTGVIGSRIDHTLANMMLLYKLLKLGIKGKIINHKNTIYLTDSSLTLKKKEGTFVSVIPIIGTSANVTLKGFEYELNNRVYETSSTLGISNIIVEDEGYIELKDGVCFVIESRD